MNIRQLAKNLKLSKSAVSYALKNDPRIAKATIARVQTAAKKYSYKPEPTVSRVMSAIARKNTGNVTAPIVLLSDWPTAQHWRNTQDSLDRFYRGLVSQAQKRGYCIEELWMRSPGMHPKRIDQILAARGTQGVIVFNYASAPATLEVDLSPYASAVWGRALVRPRIFAVDHDHHQGLFECLHQIKAQGYQRPALILHTDAHERTMHCWAAAYQFFIAQLPKNQQIPLWLIGPNDQARFRKWMKHYKPDAIISSHFVVLDYIASAGYSVPDDVGFAALFWRNKSHNVAGIDTRDEAQAAQTVDLVIEQIRTNTHGLPLYPETVLFDGVWREGPSLPLRQ